MRKKFTMLLASLFLTLGTAWAETATTHADGLYKIYWEWDKRGYLAYHNTEYPNSPQLAGVVNHNPNGHYQLTDAGINLGWYLYTSPKTGKSYLFEATTGKFITFNPADFNVVNSKQCLLSEEVSDYAMLNLLATDNESAPAFALRYVHNGTNYQFCSGCGSNKGQNPVRFATNGQSDGGIPFKFVEDNTLTITDDVKNAAIAKITAFEKYVPAHTGTRNSSNRKINKISLTSVLSEANAANTTTLTHSGNGLQYIDLTGSVTMKAKAGETVTAGVTLVEGGWINAYVYIDLAGDGFTASLDENGYTPLEDLCSYSFYTSLGGENAGYNSVGTVLSGNNRNTLAMPQFTAPTEVGTYRMRFKTDWSDIAPDGSGSQFVSALGTIVDVMLEVVSADVYSIIAPAGCTVTYNGTSYVVGDNFSPIGELTKEDFAASEREGLVARVEIDNKNKTVTLTYVPNLQAGDKVIFKNRDHSFYLGVLFEGGELDNDPVPTKKKMSGYGTNNNYKNCWELVAGTDNGEDFFYLYNPYYDWYASPISTRNGAVLMSKTTEGAGHFQFETQGDHVAIKCLNGASTGYTYLHQTNHDNNQIVDWNAEAAASQWSLDVVDEATESSWITPLGTEGDALKTNLNNYVLGDKIGLYSGMTADEKATLIANAIIPAEGTTTERIRAGVYALYMLQSKINALVLNTPQVGKFYRLKNEVSSNYMSGNKDNITLLSDGANAASTIFYVDNNNALRAVNGKYLDCKNKGYSNTALAGMFGPAYGGVAEGVITYKNNGSWTFGNYADGAGLNKGDSDPNAAGYNWIIEEVTDASAYTEMQALRAFMTKASNEFKITLQTTDNTAAGYLSSCGSADGNVEGKMIDGRNDTFYGSPWGAAVADIDYHYWQVDLGEGVSLKDFVFSYTTRANANDMPTEIIVKGSVDGVTFSEITTISEGLPAAASAVYTSETITPTVDNFRYVRFEVTGTNNNYVVAGHATQRTIAIAEFSMERRGLTEKEQTVLTVLASSQSTCDNVYSQSATDAAAAVIAARTELENAYTEMKMENVAKPTYPFTLTTDNANPVLYAIKSGRTDEGKEWWYTYIDGGKIALRQYKGEDNQLWFFKEVITDDYQYALQLYPAADKTKAMSYENTNGGADKIVAKTPGTTGWTNLWLLAKTNGDAPYGLQTYNKANYLSNNGGYTNNMGMYNAAPNADGGTAMYISSQHDAAQQLINTAKEMANEKGTTVGYYTEASVATLESAITATETNFAQGNYTMTELVSAMEGLQVILPESGRYYQIVSVLSFSEIKAIYSTGDALAWKSFDGTDKTFYWTIVPDGQGKYTLQNVGNNKYLNGLEMSQEVVTNTTLKFLTPGQFNIISNGKTFHANGHNHGNGNNGGIINYGGSANSASAWKIIEVDHPDLAVAKAGLQNRVTELNAIISNMGSAIGQYKDGNKAELQGHVATAQGVLDGGSKVPDNYTTALTTLNDAIAGFDYSLILPEAGKHYLIKSAKPEFLANQGVEMAMYSNASNGLLYWKALDEGDRTFYWTITPNNDGTSFVFQNAGDNKYIPAIANDQYTMTEDANSAQSFNLSFLGSRQFNITGSGTMHMMGHSNGNGKKDRICGFDGGLNTPSAWYIIEIDNLEWTMAVLELERAILDAMRLLDQNSTEIGYYSSNEENLAERILAINNFKRDIKEDTPIADIQAQIELANKIVKSFKINLPGVGFYRIKNYSETGHLICGEPGGRSQFASEKENSIESIFCYAENKLVSYKDGMSFAIDNNNKLIYKNEVGTGIDIKFEESLINGKLQILFNNTRYLFSENFGDTDSGDINAKNIDPAGRNANYLFTVEEVTTLPVTISNAKVRFDGNDKYVSTLFTPVALNIPDGITAYIGVDEDNYLAMEPLENIIPANTGVILMANDAKTYDFAISTAAGTAIEPGENIITGTVAKAIITPENATCYVLANGEDGVGLYRASLNKNDGTGFINNACKAYISVPVAEPQAAKALTMRLGRGSQGGTTSIESSELNAQGVQLIYDLQGRRVLNPTKGMYIVNGKKMVIK